MISRISRSCLNLPGCISKTFISFHLRVSGHAEADKSFIELRGVGVGDVDGLVLEDVLDPVKEDEMVDRGSQFWDFLPDTFILPDDME